MPTPPGLPVRMTSPGRRGRAWLKLLTIAGIEWTMSNCAAMLARLSVDLDGELDIIERDLVESDDCWSKRTKAHTTFTQDGVRHGRIPRRHIIGQTEAGDHPAKPGLQARCGQERRSRLRFRPRSRQSSARAQQCR